MHKKEKSYTKNSTLQKKKNLYSLVKKMWVRVMVFNATFNDISLVSWQSVLLVEETEESH
jgi:hypothetical protein